MYLWVWLAWLEGRPVVDGLDDRLLYIYAKSLFNFLSPKSNVNSIAVCFSLICCKNSLRMGIIQNNCCAWMWLCVLFPLQLARKNQGTVIIYCVGSSSSTSSPAIPYSDKSPRRAVIAPWEVPRRERTATTGWRTRGWWRGSVTSKSVTCCMHSSRMAERDMARR